MCVCVCVFPLQSGDFLTVDRCKVQGARYQDDSPTDTTVVVCFWNNTSFLFSSAKSPLSIPFSNLSFLTPCPVHLSARSSHGSLLFFQEKPQREGACKGEHTKQPQPSIMDQRRQQHAGGVLTGGDRMRLVCVCLCCCAVESVQPVAVTPGSPSELHAARSFPWSTNPVQSEYLSCRSGVSSATC